MSPRPRQPPGYWYDGRTPPWYARLLAGVYAAAVRARAGLYRRGVLRSAHPGRPVLVVGNLIAGGSGKTPLTIAIVERLRDAGWRPGVASRGYGRDQASIPRWVEAGTEPDLGGDEPVLIARRTGVPVRVDADRVAAAQALIANGCDVVVCDDGLQHLRLARDLEIEVIDGRRRYGNGRLLPAGPLREPAERGADCDFRVVNLGVARSVAGISATERAPGETASDRTRSDQSPDESPDQTPFEASAPAGFESAAPEAGFGEWPMHLRPADAQALRGGRSLPLHAFVGQRVHAVAGIGDPERFFAMLRGLGIAVVPHAFPDHHRYRADDLDFGSDLPVLMTEKDAVKCASFATDACWSVAIRAELPEAFWVALLDRLRAHAGEMPE